MNIRKILCALLSTTVLLTGCSSSIESVGPNAITDSNLESTLSLTNTSDTLKSKVTKKAENVDTTFWPEAAKFHMKKTTATKIIKGDLIEIEGKEKVRLIGITTEKHSEDGRIYYNIPEKDGVEYLKKKILNQTVYIEQNPAYKKNEHGELLAYVWIGDSKELKNVNALLLQNGLGMAKRMDPETIYDKAFKSIENKAKSNQIGLWKLPNK